MTTRSLYLLLMILLCAAPCVAVTSASVALAKDPVTGLTADEAITLGEQVFFDVYVKKTRTLSDHSDDGAKYTDAEYTFSHLRRYINDRATKKRSKAQQALIKRIRINYTHLMTDYLHIEDASSAGDTTTAYTADAMICVENAVGKMIQAMAQPRSNPQGRHKAVKTLTTLLAELKNLPATSTHGAQSETFTKEHDLAILRLRIELNRLQRLLPQIPDNGCITLAQFADKASQYALEPGD